MAKRRNKATVLVDGEELPFVVRGGRRYVHDPWLTDGLSPWHLASTPTAWALSTKHWRQRGYHKGARK